jgi:predicted ATPase
LRRRAQLTQRELGLAVGYSEAQIARLEGGKRLPDVAAVKGAFISPLGLEHDADLAARLVELAAAARANAPPADGRARPDSAAPHLPATNLVGQLTRFIGREREMAEVKELLRANRLVTFIGSGGVGKTRLALEVAAACVREDALSALHFADGVWLVELAALTDPALLPQTVAAIFQLPEQPEHTYTDVVVSYLNHKAVLLVIDNCEHLIDATAQLIEHLLRLCPGVVVLATSREPLRVPGEVAWRVPAMTTPDPVNLPPYERLLDYEATRLFLDHALAASPGFSLTPRNMAAIVQICHRLDGIPLAIEMAAAQVAALSVEEIAAGLNNRFKLLISGSRTALLHHQTLRAALDWSYALLSAAEQALFARLAVFVAGWTAEAAREVCGEPDNSAYLMADGSIAHDDVLFLLLQLAQKSMVMAVVRDGQTRYQMLETIREYAKEKLRERGETELLREHHLAYYLAMAEQYTELGGRQHFDWMARLDPEHDNMRKAFASARACNDNGERMLRLAGALRSWLHDRGRFHEGQAMLEEALERGRNGPAQARAKAIYGKASVLTKLSDYRQAIPLFAESLSLYEEVNNVFGMAWASMLLCNLTLAAELDVERAEAYIQRSLPLFQQLQSPFGVCCALTESANLRLWRGQRAAGLADLEQALGLAQDVEDARQVARILELIHGADPRRGLKLWKKAMAHLRARGQDEALATMQEYYAWVLIDKGDYGAALETLAEGMGLWQRLGKQWSPGGGIGSTALAQGYAERLLEHWAEARRCLDECVRVSREVGDTYSVNHAQWLLASILIEQDDLKQAGKSLRHSVRQFQQRGNLLETAMALTPLAHMARVQGDIPRAMCIAGGVAVYAEKAMLNTRMPYGMWVACRNTVAALRERLHDPELVVPWARGQRMSLDELVTFALSEADAKAA